VHGEGKTRGNRGQKEPGVWFDPMLYKVTLSYYLITYNIFNSECEYCKKREKHRLRKGVAD
jgi:hypothetical protein